LAVTAFARDFSHLASFEFLIPPLFILISTPDGGKRNQTINPVAVQTMITQN
jgi:hypothetical protein